jgi:hypothetical protein
MFLSCFENLHTRPFRFKHIQRNEEKFSDTLLASPRSNPNESIVKNETETNTGLSNLRRIMAITSVIEKALRDYRTRKLEAYVHRKLQPSGICILSLPHGVGLIHQPYIL